MSTKNYSGVKIYIEGGGEQKRLKTECRRAFSAFFQKAGFEGKMPRVVACGSRNEAFSDFCSSIKNAKRTNELAFLLVDSEDTVGIDLQSKPWDYLRQRDHWNQPAEATHEQAHLMIQCMESWFLADQDTLRQFFGKGFNSHALPRNSKIEEIEKTDVFKSLENASRSSEKGSYGKADHSFKILEKLDSEKIIASSPSVQRLIHELEKVL